MQEGTRRYIEHGIPVSHQADSCQQFRWNDERCYDMNDYQKLKDVLMELIQEQSKGEWDDATVKSDVVIFALKISQTFPELFNK